MLIYFMATWPILRPFGIFCDHLVYFFRFGMLYQEKSGNTDSKPLWSFYNCQARCAVNKTFASYCFVFRSVTKNDLHRKQLKHSKKKILSHTYLAFFTLIWHRWYEKLVIFRQVGPFFTNVEISPNLVTVVWCPTKKSCMLSVHQVPKYKVKNKNTNTKTNHRKELPE
jgi:hypothetical protein